jgi:hypothetical protein
MEELSMKAFDLPEMAKKNRATIIFGGKYYEIEIYGFAVGFISFVELAQLALSQSTGKRSLGDTEKDHAGTR